MGLADFPSWVTPLVQCMLVQSLTGLTTGFAPSQSFARPVVAAITALVAYRLLPRGIGDCFDETRFAGPVVAMCWVNVLNAIDLLVLSRVSYEAQVEWEVKQRMKVDGRDLFVHRLIWSLGIPYNYRRINTPWQIQRLPSVDSRDPRRVPSRRYFLLHGAAKLFVSLGMIQAFTIDAEDVHLSRAVERLALHPSRSTAAPAILFWITGSWSACLVRLLATVSFGIVTRAAIVAGYTGAGVVSVLLGLSEPAAWPPVFGSLAEAWCLRRFWGIAWHQTLRQLLSANANYLASLLGVSPSSRRGYFFRLAFAFAVSGAVHSLVDMAFGVSLVKSGGIWFFALQVPGCVLESAVQSIASPLGNCTRLSTKRKIGYCWVVLFLLCATPVWITPILLALYKDGQRIPSPFLCFSSWPL
ncbi:hypothetical protein ARAM_004618 [Aspergillus rambellii]|uniref:Wax synthase domain-containing protein n=1 Tax=Aspergillus rambellii TaxID=308745 RepID=A0A0F8WXE1_9EURO|nr:hypothetical protein ARAM_004618 [Aspergillus rambellii]